MFTTNHIKTEKHTENGNLRQSCPQHEPIGQQSVSRNTWYTPISIQISGVML